MAAYWRDEREREREKILRALALSFSLWQKKNGGKRTKAVVCLNIPDPTAVIKGDEREQYTLTPFE
jgi:hypothetical protein